MNTSQKIARMLRELRQLKRDIKPYGTPDFASAWAMRSIERHERDLIEELRATKVIESNHALLPTL